MKFKKLIFYILIILSVFLIYKLTYVEKENYVVLGDSLAVGQNPYGNEDYGYSDYLADYLLENNRLNSYISEFANRDYKINNILEDINNNKNVVSNGQKINIRSSLRESTLVTLSIGFNDFIELIDKPIVEKNSINKLKIKNNIDIVLNELDVLISSIKKYAKNDIYVIGYYNPYPYFETYRKDIEEVIEYADKGLEYICFENKVKFIKISDVFENKLEFFSNSLDRHPNISGYERIFIKIRDQLYKF